VPSTNSFLSVTACCVHFHDAIWLKFEAEIGITISASFYMVFKTVYYFIREPVNSVSIVSGYGLDDRTIEVRSLEEAKDFSFSLCVQPALGPTQPPVHWVPDMIYTITNNYSTLLSFSVVCWLSCLPLDSRFACSDPIDDDGF
jgi:hypothetical protein